MKVILIRHGIAEKPSKEVEDSNRELTEKGIQAIKDSASLLKERLEGQDEIFIWASPTQRTIQTAILIQEELKIAGIEKYDFIQKGDYKQFAAKVKCLNDKTTLLVVGHEPHLGIWSEKISVKPLKFKKGTIAAFDVISPNVLKGELKWIIHGTESIEKSIGKPSGMQIISIKNIKNFLLKSIDEINDVGQVYIDRPDDPEVVHQLRVKIRQLRSLISFFAPILNEECQKHKDSLSNIANCFSYLREIDVITEEWSKIKEESNGSLGDLDMLSVILEKERAREQEHLLQEVSQGFIQSNLYGITKWIISLDEKNSQDSDIEEQIENRFIKWNKKTGKAIKLINLNDIQELHKIRIGLKKIRYVQSSIPSLSSFKKWSLKDLKDLQDRLGIICDINIIYLALKNIMNHYDSAKLWYEIGIYSGYKLSQKEFMISRLEKEFQ